jgi:hypothetical protein
MVKIVDSMAILDNAHSIMGVAASKLVGVAANFSHVLCAQTVKHPPSL